MLKLFKLTAAAFAITLFITSNAVAGDAAAKKSEITPQQCVDLVETSVKLINEKGEKDAFALLTDPAGDYVKGSLYVFIYDLDGTIVAHLNPKLVGKNLLGIKDVKGKAFAAEFVEIAKSESGKGWSQYWWPRPGEKKPSLKTSFLMKVPGKDLLVGVGVYDISVEQVEALGYTIK